MFVAGIDYTADKFKLDTVMRAVETNYKPEDRLHAYGFGSSFIVRHFPKGSLLTFKMTSRILYHSVVNKLLLCGEYSILLIRTE